MATMGNKRVPYSRVPRNKVKNFKRGKKNLKSKQNESMDQTNCVLGRRIVDIEMWFKQIAVLANHNWKNCQFSFLEIISEKSEGLRSGFTVKCKKCRHQSVIWTDDPEKAGGEMDINSAATSGIFAIGGDHSKLEAMCRSLNLPFMNNETHGQCEKHLGEKFLETAVDEMEGATLEGTSSARDEDRVQPIALLTSSWAKRPYHSRTSLASDVPSVAEPVQVFVDVPTVLIASSDDPQEEVDPLENEDRPLDGACEKRQIKRPLDRDGQDVAEPQICNGLPQELVAFSLTSDIIISNEDRDEKPNLPLETFCCSQEDCRRMFDSWGELNNHWRSCHLPFRGVHHASSVGCWHRNVQDEIQKTATSENITGKVDCGGSSSENQLKSRKRRRSVDGKVNSNSTTISLADGMDPKQVKNTTEYANDHFMSDSSILLSGDSSKHFEAATDVGAMVKVEFDEDVRQDFICNSSKFFCNECSLAFKEEFSLKKHMSEKHLKCNAVHVSGGEGESNLKADTKIDTHIKTPGVGDMPLKRKDLMGGQPGNISLSRDAHDTGSTLSQQQQVNTKTSLRVVSPASLMDSKCDLVAETSGNGTISIPRFDLSNVSEGLEVAQSGKFFADCDICGSRFEADGDADLEASGGGTASICKTCVEKFKPTTGGVMGRYKNPRFHQCHVCGQTYLMKSALKRHEMVHTGERPYVCSICSRTFTRSEYLRIHMKSHDLMETTEWTS